MSSLSVIVDVATFVIIKASSFEVFGGAVPVILKIQVTSNESKQSFNI